MPDHHACMLARRAAGVPVLLFSLLLLVAIPSCGPAPDSATAGGNGGDARGADTSPVALPGGRSGGSSGRYNVAIVVLDACRPDKLGCYGFERETSPNIDRLAADPDSLIYRRHYVQGAWTKASVASIFTGLFVHQHGVVLGHEETQRTGAWREYTTQVLPDTHVTLAERMKAEGYATFGVVKSYHLTPEYGFSQGFDDYYTPKEIGKDARRVQRFLELASEANGPFFGYLHLNACHYPFFEDNRDEAYMRQYATGYDEAARRAAGIDFTTSEISHEIKKGMLTLDPADVAYLNLIYEAQLRQVDEILVGPLIEGLRAAGLYDDTLVVLTADHGEELYDHRGYAHGHALWEEVIHVPMIVKFPKGARPPVPGREVTALTRSIDFYPSVLAFIGAPAPQGLPGVPVLQGVYPSFSVSETKRDWSLTEEGWKLIWRKEGESLFHLDEDPTELTDLAASEPSRVRAMEEEFEKLKEADASTSVPAPTVETTLDEDAVENLRALGYIR